MFDLENIKNKVYYLMFNNIITDEDIDILSNYTLNDLNNLDTKNSYKAKLLFSIYINPYLLCNDTLVNLDNFNLNHVTKLIIKRYNEEVYEYELLFHNGDISYLEYYNNVKALNILYFESSNIGRRIGIINRDKILMKIK